MNRMKKMLKVCENGASEQLERLKSVFEVLWHAKAEFDVVDTIVIEQGVVIQWYFSSMSNRVMRKRKAKLTLKQIKKSFVNQALCQGPNVAKSCSVLHQVNDDGFIQSILLNDTQFNIFIGDLDSPHWKKTLAMQPFIIGKNGRDHSTVLCRYIRMESGRARTDCYQPNEYTYSVDPRNVGFQSRYEMFYHTADISGTKMADIVGSQTRRLVRYLELNRTHTVAFVVVEFVLSKTHRLMFTKATQLVYEEDLLDVSIFESKPETSDDDVKVSLPSKSATQIKHEKRSDNPNPRPFLPPCLPWKCPGEFCNVNYQLRGEDDREQSFRIVQKSIIFAKAESEFLKQNNYESELVRLYPDQGKKCEAQLPNQAVEEESLHPSLDQLIVERCKTLQITLWHEILKASSVNYLTTSYLLIRYSKLLTSINPSILLEHTHVCSSCYVTYQRLDQHREQQCRLDSTTWPKSSKEMQSTLPTTTSFSEEVTRQLDHLMRPLQKEKCSGEYKIREPPQERFETSAAMLCLASHANENSTSPIKFVPVLSFEGPYSSRFDVPEMKPLILRKKHYANHI